MTSSAVDSTNTERAKLKRRAILGGGVEVLGFGAAQVLRLGGNLILTRLLSPDAFGLAALVSLTAQGLYMFSDVGIQPAVVRHEHGGEERFLNTAWTMQLMRGAVLGILTLLLAWPMARIYGEPRLTGLMLLGAVLVFAYSLHSTSLYSLRRNVIVAPLVALEVGVQIVTLIVVIGAAYWLRSAWALVIGMATSNLVRAAVSFWLPSETKHKHRLCWDRDVVHYIRDFGKWIFMSSALSFLSRQGDRLILGKLLGVTELGIYSIAVMLSEAMNELITRITHGVIFPLLSRVREEGPERMRRVYYRTRLALDALSLPALGALFALGSHVVDLLFDHRYHEAGWMLEALTVRVAMSCTLTPCETSLNALGQSRFGFMMGLGRSAWIGIGVPIGFHFAGLHGIVWAMAFSELPVLGVLWPAMRKAGLLQYPRELLSLAMFGGGYGLGRLIELLLPRI